MAAISRVDGDCRSKSVANWRLLVLNFDDDVIHCSRGFVQLTLSNYQVARDAFRAASSLIAQTKVAVEFEAEILCGLADCCLGLGEYTQAAEMARLGLDKARAQTNRVAQCRALIAMALSGQAEPDAESQAQSTLGQAQQLISQTGAVFLLERWQHAQSLLCQSAP